MFFFGNNGIGLAPLLLSQIWRPFRFLGSVMEPWVNSGLRGTGFCLIVSFRPEFFIVWFALVRIPRIRVRFST